MHRLQFVCLDDDAELQHQLWGALQERGQQMQHADVCKLVDHHPVVAPALRLGTLAALDAQVDGVEIPEATRQETGSCCHHQRRAVEYVWDAKSLTVYLLLVENTH